MPTSVFSVLETLDQILLTKLLLWRPSSIQPAIFTNITFQLPCWVITGILGREWEQCQRFKFTPYDSFITFPSHTWTIWVKKKCFGPWQYDIEFLSTPQVSLSHELAFLFYYPHLTPEALEQPPYRIPSFIPPTLLHPIHSCQNNLLRTLLASWNLITPALVSLPSTPVSVFPWILKSRVKC